LGTIPVYESNEKNTNAEKNFSKIKIFYAIRIYWACNRLRSAGMKKIN
jgi:hypothetical protein